MLDVDLEVVLQVGTHRRNVRYDRDPECLEVSCGSNPRQLQQLRRVDRAPAQDHLAGLERLGATALSLDLDANRPTVVESDRRDEGALPNGQVPSMADRVQVGPRGRQAGATMDVQVERPEGLLAIAVDVWRRVVVRL